MRSFDDWWKTIPADLAQEVRRSEEQSKPSLNQVSHTLLQLHLSGKNDANPSYEELRSWIDSGQVDVLRFRYNM
ncbi:MAG TPA: hypothetical protein VH500_05585 [Nitrososphaeraceae archaeon]|jgi:hypothetical protein